MELIGVDQSLLFISAYQLPFLTDYFDPEDVSVDFNRFRRLILVQIGLHD